MTSYVFSLQAIDKTQGGLVGGKAANLGELARLDGLHVPPGFCVSTEAYRTVVTDSPAIGRLIEQLSSLAAQERENIAALSASIRSAIETAPIPQEIAQEVSLHLAALGAEDPYAVRSSATAEDLPGASFAGQHDTYLNVVGTQAILRHIARCWASLFGERAVVYRLQNGFDQRDVAIAVVVQKMVFPQASGVLFTADPVTANRKVLSIDAAFGLGEALVSGLVNADNYKVRDGQVIDKQIAAKKLAVNALREGGVQTEEVPPQRQREQVLADEQIVQLAQLGRQIETHFGDPQDVEWCLVGDSFAIVQSRPITTLYPIPQAGEGGNRVYLSVGHNQMMSDAMKPLGLSFFLLTTPAPMRTAGGRLFVDVTQHLASHAGRQALLANAGRSDPLIKDALMTLIERGDFVPPLPEEGPPQGAGAETPAGAPAGAPQGAPPPIEADPRIVHDLIASTQASIEEMKRAIQTQAGPALFDFILQDIPQLRSILFNPQSTRVFMAAMDASAWINDHMLEWLGEKNVADTLSQSVPNNVTSEMGLALLDVADVIRPHAQVVEFLRHVQDDSFLEALAPLPGGAEAKAAIDGFLDRYGMRCPGEIDITKPRWREQPSVLVPLLLGNIKHFAPGEAQRRFEKGRQEALHEAQELLDRLRSLPDGEAKAAETRRRIDLLRTFIGYREYPKYAMIQRYFVYKQALLKEAERLVGAGVIAELQDIYYLSFEELRAAAAGGAVDREVIRRRKDEYQRYEKLTPPRVITSDGEIIRGAYRREHLPGGALEGLGVSAGVVEGRARVILRLQDADLQAGDILVTAYTDPSWTPLFVSLRGLVTEVGGLMTHGAVIAREYGLPAVVGVENATKLIQDGQRIRVHGAEGYVELL
jgi:pyruvate,water dikinase